LKLIFKRESRDKEVTKFAESVLEAAKTERQYDSPDPHMELLRYRIANDLRSFLATLCKSHSLKPPSYAFERWILSQRLVDPSGADPLLPSDTSIINFGLVHEFERVGLSTENSIQICKDLAEECAKSIATLKSREESSSDDQLDRGTTVSRPILTSKSK
jgi:hypothetical protein